jgi:hypothetical protein
MGTRAPSTQPPFRAGAGRYGIAWWEASALLRRHLPDHERPAGHLLADVTELLFVLLLLAQLVGTWHVLS